MADTKDSSWSPEITHAACTCNDPGVACPACLARRDRHGFPTDWQERMRQEAFCPACGKAGVATGLDHVLLETRPSVRRHACGVGGPGAGEIECQHQWLDRPESDTRECLICGTEVAG